MTFRTECTCGHAIYQGGENKEEASQKLRDRTTQAGLDAHFAKFHQGGDKPSLEQAKSMMAQNLVLATDAWGIKLPPVTATA